MSAGDERPREQAGVRTPLSLVWPIVAGWALPGLGHVVLGRVRRGVAFFVLVFGAFSLGVAHDGRLALRDPAQPLLTTLQVVANVGVGPADAVARVAVYGRPVYSVRSRLGSPDLERMRERLRSPMSNYGTAYLWAAGLMNLLLLFDVWDIGRGRKP